jgi:hypothetical protein
VSSPAAACDFVDGGGKDGPIVQPQQCFTPPVGAAEELCLPAVPMGTTVLSGRIDDCLHGTSITYAGNSYCMIAAGEIRITGRVEAAGSYPLMLLASQKIVVEVGATLDVSSRFGQERGAGSQPTTCGTLSLAATMPSGGGAGGTFQGYGGNGSGAGAGTRSANSRGLAFEGGCGGGDGGAANAMGGRGAGAMFLSAPLVEIHGDLLAVGEGGGAPGAQVRGGGGGGSGGYIGVYATSAGGLTLDPAARLIAAGGGGGAGRNDSNDEAEPGEQATAADPLANGGNGPGRGGDGSSPLLGADGNISTNSDTTVGGGGGGGGGAGYIDIKIGGFVMACAFPQCVPEVPM